MPTCKFTEAELVRFAGTDAATYLRVQSFGKCLWLMKLCQLASVCHSDC